MIHPHLAIVLFAHLWWNINKKLEKNFLKIQRKAIRTISKSNYNTPTALEILPIDELLIHSQGLLVHSILQLLPTLTQKHQGTKYQQGARPQPTYCKQLLSTPGKN